jgi:hypothetical protein
MKLKTMFAVAMTMLSAGWSMGQQNCHQDEQYECSNHPMYHDLLKLLESNGGSVKCTKTWRMEVKSPRKYCGRGMPMMPMNPRMNCGYDMKNMNCNSCPRCGCCW